MPRDGCNMNDKAYPFRGEYRMPPSLNHGHSPANKFPPTALNLRVTGTNLTLHTIEAPIPNTVMSCDLVVGKFPARDVTDMVGSRPLDVPADGQEYQLAATVHAKHVKHHCKLTLVCSDVSPPTHQALTLPEPTYAHLTIQDVHRNTLRVVEVDGNPWASREDGQLSLFATNQHQYALVVDGVPSAPLVNADAIVPIVEATAEEVAAHVPLSVWCQSTGEQFPLTIGGSALRLPTNKGTLVLRIPRGNNLHLGVSIDVKVSYDESSMGQGRLYAAVFAASCSIDLAAEDAKDTGFGMCKIPLDGRRPNTVSITVRDNSNQVVLRQSLVIPPLSKREALAAAATSSSPPPPIDVQISDGPGKVRVLTTAIGGVVSFDGASFEGHLGVPVDCAAPKTVVVYQKNLDGTVSSARVQLDARREQDEGEWLRKLAGLLESAQASVPRRDIVQRLHGFAEYLPVDEPKRRVLNGIIGLVSRSPPSLELNVQPNGTLTNIQCAPDYEVHVPQAATVPKNGSFSPPSLPAVTTLDVVNRSTRDIEMSTKVGIPEYPELKLVQDMLNACKAHRAAVDAANLVANEFEQNVIRTNSAQGRELVPALAALLRRNVVPPPPVNSAAPLATLPQPPAAASVQELKLCVSDRGSEGTQVLWRHDGGSPQPLTLNSTVPIPLRPLPLLLDLKSSPFVKHVVEEYQKSSPKPLRERWHDLSPETSLDKALRDILLKLTEESMTPMTLPPMRPLSLGVGRGCLTNVLCEGCDISAQINTLPDTYVPPRSSIPPSGCFTEGSETKVTLKTRDKSTGQSRPDVELLISNPSSSRCVEYLDVALSLGALRLKCPPEFSIDVSEERNPACSQKRFSNSQVAVTMDPAVSHDFVARVTNGEGKVLFVQCINVPSMVAPDWSIELSRNQPTIVCSCVDKSNFTVTVDGEAERVVTMPTTLEKLSHDATHWVHLKKYDGDGTTASSQLKLRLDMFVDYVDVQRIIAALRSAITTLEKARAALMDIAQETKSGLLRLLIAELMKWLEQSQTPEAQQRDLLPAPRVFFRLYGEEETTLRKR